jgi:hypothetical protein
MARRFSELELPIVELILWRYSKHRLNDFVSVDEEEQDID